MKKYYPIFLITLGFALSMGLESIAQCNPTDHAKNCISKIQDGFIFVKSFSIDGQQGSKDEVEYSYVFTKDTQYYLNVCTSEDGPDGIVVTVFDSRRNPVSTNFADGKFFPAIIFQCKATGIYYINFTFRDSKNFCGGSVLAFKK